MEEKIRLYDQNVWYINVGKRLLLIRKLIDKYKPDICTFQEFNIQNIRGANPSLQYLLSDVYAEACTQYSSSAHVAIFFKREKYTEIESGCHIFEGLNDVGTKGIIWAVLQNKTTGKYVAYALHIFGTNTWMSVTICNA